MLERLLDLLDLQEKLLLTYKYLLLTILGMPLDLLDLQGNLHLNLSYLKTTIDYMQFALQDLLENLFLNLDHLVQYQLMITKFGKLPDLRHLLKNFLLFLCYLVTTTLGKLPDLL